MSPSKIIIIVIISFLCLLVGIIPAQEKHLCNEDSRTAAEVMLRQGAYPKYKNKRIGRPMFPWYYTEKNTRWFKGWVGIYGVPE